VITAHTHQRFIKSAFRTYEYLLMGFMTKALILES